MAEAAVDAPEGERMDAFIQRNLDYDDYERGRSALNEAFKRDFPEMTCAKKRRSCLEKIRAKITNAHAH